MKNVVLFTAVSASGLESVVDPNFGRAGAFVLIDADSGTVVNQFNNSSKEASHGAGVVAAATVASLKVAGVVSGRFGPKAYAALETISVPMWIVPSTKQNKSITVATALQMLRNGALTQQRIKVLT